MYQTTEIASKAGIHPNTVRIYEEWGYISPVPRADNGYRIYSDLHLFQLLVARTAFRCEIVQGQIREKARAIVQASGREDFRTAIKLAEDYLTHLEKEHIRALEAIELVEKWLDGKDSLISAETYTRNEVAQLLEVSNEIIRNWERNGLLTVPRLPNGYRRYTEKEMNRMKIIRSLRHAHYSMSAILRLLNTTEKSTELNVKQVLDTPAEYEDIVTVTDRLIHSLEDAIWSAREVIRLLNQAVR
ncbi:DNA-binding transcriptional regulator, MerR family [Fontibacillus panacisegetis]|uniref:DNA-binding transcriptional regulator, MerR family n=1 Tax=Fontibacillus panacisegetis TaxID=670482 RepID=A0A1G7EG29_9BACL|nr:MerR family transcriptional regulator [Fontibacillus panacisegetis]SDE62640.1 DNA-binding transcriptional regulator, MerR family [Fontibacillus panacisegetis]